MLERILRWVLQQLSLMRTAIGMLGTVAFCSMIGTWIVQGLPLQDYVAQFGVFWGQVVWYGGLGDVYRAPWFLAILATLIASVCACLLRNGPFVWAQLRGVKHLPSLRQAKGIAVGDDTLKAMGFWRLGEVDGYVLWERGRLNRLGYFLVHGGVVGIAVAGLFTGFLGWRGNLNLREGEADNVVLVWNGTVATPRFLPFRVRNEGFDISFFESGMPKGYATRLRFEPSLKDKRLQEKKEEFAGPSRLAPKEDLGSAVPCKKEGRLIAPLARSCGREAVVEVNKPFALGKYTFYQASFGDGGSRVAGTGVNLQTGVGAAFAGKVYEKASLADGTRVELLDARLNTVETGDGAPHDVGPSVDYLVQPPDAPARQLRAYRDMPDVMGVADGTTMRGGATAVVYRPMDVRGYAEVLQAVAPHGDEVTDDDVVRAAIALRVKGLDGEAKVVEALRLWQVHRLVRELDLRYMLRMTDFELARYSGLMVAHDPGVWLFWPSAFLGVLGVVLMMGRRLVRVFVKGGKGYVVSPHGVRIVGEMMGLLDEGMKR